MERIKVRECDTSGKTEQAVCLERSWGRSNTVRKTEGTVTTGRATDTALKGMQGNFIVIIQKYLLLLTRKLMIDDP